MAIVTSLTAKLAMKKLVTFCMLCDDATTQITNVFPTTDIKDIAPYKVHKSMIMPGKYSKNEIWINGKVGNYFC